MKDGPKNTNGADNPMRPAVVDRATWQARIDQLRVKEKAHTCAGDALAAERRRLPMVEVDPTTKLIGADGPAERPVPPLDGGRAGAAKAREAGHQGLSTPRRAPSTRPPR